MPHIDIQVTWEELIYKSPKFPGLQEYPHDGVYLSVCLSMSWEDRALYKSSYIIDLRIGFTRRYRPVSYSAPRKYLVCGYGLRATGYGLQASNHGVVSFLNNLLSASAYVNNDFIKISKRYRAHHSFRQKRRSK